MGRGRGRGRNRGELRSLWIKVERGCGDFSIAAVFSKDVYALWVYIVDEWLAGVSIGICVLQRLSYALRSSFQHYL